MKKEFIKGVISGLKAGAYVSLVIFCYLGLSWYYRTNPIIQSVDPIVAVLLFLLGLPISIFLRVDDMGALLASIGFIGNQYALGLGLIIVIVNFCLLKGLAGAINLKNRRGDRKP
ncbi:MAG: hypothetical protein IT292_03520 [Deltaproteobacteria bacterium]|nr:hypothetical protein [Deltaproteobacteria bacterium]